LWWGFLASLPVAGYRIIRRRDRDLGLVLAFYGVLFLPWFAVARTHYIYYALPCVPFMALALTGTVQSLSKRNARAAGWLLAILAVGVGAAFLPIWLGLPTSSTWLAHLRWLPRWP
jgi:dolichyl-phosphate-mannose--protein O-mannosyl transferase